MIILFGEGQSGNRFFQLSYLKSNFPNESILIIESFNSLLPCFKIDRILRTFKIMIHPFFYNYFYSMLWILFRLLKLDIFTEKNEKGFQGFTGELVSSNKFRKSRFKLFSDFFMIYKQTNFDYKLFYKNYYSILYHKSDQKKCRSYHEIEFFLHIRTGDYRNFNVEGSYLNFQNYLEYYKEALIFIKEQKVEVHKIPLFSDNLNDELIPLIANFAQEIGFEIIIVTSDNCDWFLMLNSNYGGICSASTFSFSALLSSPVSKFGIFPKYWLNFFPNYCYPQSILKSQFIEKGNLWILE